MIKVIYDNYLSKIEGMTEIQYAAIKTRLKYEEPYMTRMSIKNTRGFMPERWKYLINSKGFFYSGLLGDVMDVLDQMKVEYEFESKVKFPEMSDEDIKQGIFRLKQMPVTPRPYQMEAVFTAIDGKRGAIVAGTGAGKGVIIAGLCTFLYTKTLIILDSVDIAEQLAKELYQYTGISTGLIKGGRWETEQLITVAVIDSLHSKTKGKMKKDVKAFIDSIELLIVDEAHHASAPTYEGFMQKCSAPYRFGLTATALGSYYRGENGLTSNEPLLKGIIGSTLWQKTSTDLVKEGWLSVPTIYMLEHRMNFEGETGLYSDEERHWIIENEERNMKAAKIVKQAVEDDKNCIVFVSRVEHGKILVKLLEDIGLDKDLIRYAYGEITGADRQRMFQDFKSGEAKVLVGTVLSEGLNFQIGVGINLAGGQTPRLALQRLGRILRKPKGPNGDVDLTTPTYTTYYDFLDVGHPIFKKHAKERQDIYSKQGHEVKTIVLEKPTRKKKKTTSIEEF